MQATFENSGSHPTSGNSNLIGSLASKSLPLRLLALGLWLLFAGALVGVTAMTLFGSSLYLPLMAFGACFISALLAHVFSEYPQGHVYFAARMALQLTVRTILPLALCVWGLYIATPALDKSLVFFAIIFYLVGLVADVQLTLARLRSEPSQPN